LLNRLAGRCDSSREDICNEKSEDLQCFNIQPVGPAGECLYTSGCWLVACYRQG
jgi:hypothetical protein